MRQENFGHEQRIDAFSFLLSKTMDIAYLSYRYLKLR